MSTFPTLAGVAYDVKKTPVWSTRVQTANSGKEQRLNQWTYPRWKFQLVYNFLRQNVNSEFQTLVGFINSMYGQFNQFYYQDSSDYSYTSQSLGVGDGTTKNFAIVRSLGGFVEPVLHAPTVSAVYLNGVSQATPAVWSATASTGGYGTDTITFVTAPGVGVAITADFIMNYVCRFTNDENEFNQMMNQLWEMKTLNFESVK